MSEESAMNGYEIGRRLEDIGTAISARRGRLEHGRSTASGRETACIVTGIDAMPMIAIRPAVAD